MQRLLGREAALDHQLQGRKKESVDCMWKPVLEPGWSLDWDGGKEESRDRVAFSREILSDLGGVMNKRDKKQADSKFLSWGPLEDGGATFEDGGSGEEVGLSWEEDRLELRILGCEGQEGFHLQPACVM